MKHFVATVLTFSASPAFAHGQADASFAGSVLHHLTAIDHAGLFWGCVTLALGAVVCLAIQRAKS